MRNYISPKPTSGPRRQESVLGHNFRLARMQDFERPSQDADLP
jgi:hypothetical protein